MNSNKDYRFLQDRRSLLVALLISPFLFNLDISDDKIEEIKILPSNKEGEFIVLGGWVLLNDDLIENLG